MKNEVLHIQIIKTQLCEEKDTHGAPHILCIQMKMPHKQIPKGCSITSRDIAMLHTFSKHLMVDFVAGKSLLNPLTYKTRYCTHQTLQNKANNPLRWYWQAVLLRWHPKLATFDTMAAITPLVLRAR